jgi:hypothetical protein
VGDKEQSSGGRNSGGQGTGVWGKEQWVARNRRLGEGTVEGKEQSSGERNSGGQGTVVRGKEQAASGEAKKQGKEQKSRKVINQNRKYGNMQGWQDTKRGRLEGKLLKS